MTYSLPEVAYFYSHNPLIKHPTGQDLSTWLWPEWPTTAVATPLHKQTNKHTLLRFQSCIQTNSTREREWKRSFVAVQVLAAGGTKNLTWNRRPFSMAKFRDNQTTPGRPGVLPIKWMIYGSPGKVVFGKFICSGSCCVFSAWTASWANETVVVGGGGGGFDNPALVVYTAVKTDGRG